MKLTVFQSDDGDCLLVESADGKHMLVDGGRQGAFHEHVAPTLAGLGALDLVCLSHIDADHIEGVLALMDDTVDWRVHDFQVSGDNPGHRAPKQPRPPKVGELWHNAFTEQVKQGTGPIRSLLANTAARLDFGSEDDVRLAGRHRGLAESVGQAIRLSRRVSPAQLGIPLNKAFGGKLALVRDGKKTFPLGSIRLTVLAPFEADLEVLRKDWKTWLKANTTQLAKIRSDMRGDVQRLGNGEVAGFRASLALQASDLGDRKQVTAPNLASLMLLAREGARTMLLTGDGHADDIIKGLEHAGDLAPGGGIHVDVLKVQHHGSLFNITDDFCRRVTADHYVFCSNGANENPDPPTLEAIFAARLTPGGKAFKLWFNSSSKVADAHGSPAHMAQVEQTVRAAAQQHPALLSFEFLEQSSFSIQL